MKKILSLSAVMKNREGMWVFYSSENIIYHSKAMLKGRVTRQQVLDRITDKFKKRAQHEFAQDNSHIN